MVTLAGPRRERRLAGPGPLVGVDDLSGHALDEHAPTSVIHRVCAVNLERDDRVASCRVQFRSHSGADENIPVEESKVHGENDWKRADTQGHSSEMALAEQAHALLAGEDFEAVA